MRSRNAIPGLPFVICMLALALCCPALWGQAGNPPQRVPTVDADAGECAMEFTVRDGRGGPVEGALIRLNADYGFMGMHELDLEVRTNAGGRARFEGLPDKTDGVLFFEASSGQLRGIAVADPQDGCNVLHAIILAPHTTPVYTAVDSDQD